MGGADFSVVRFGLQGGWDVVGPWRPLAASLDCEFWGQNLTFHHWLHPTNLH